MVAKIIIILVPPLIVLSVLGWLFYNNRSHPIIAPYWAMIYRLFIIEDNSTGSPNASESDHPVKPGEESSNQEVDHVKCNICIDREKNFVCIPCGHAFCSVCIKELSLCPLCRASVKEKYP